MDEKGFVSFRFKKERGLCYNKQRKPVFYKFGNFVVTKTEALGRGVFAEPCQGVVIPEEEAIDIDTQRDLELAEWYLREKKI